MFFFQYYCYSLSKSTWFFKLAFAKLKREIEPDAEDTLLTIVMISKAFSKQHNTNIYFFQIWFRQILGYSKNPKIHGCVQTGNN